MVGIISVAMVMSMSMTAFAGQWQSDANGWWWQNDNGSYPTNTWQWIDGNNDGTAESYYFNPQGYCLMNTTTPDGYTVNPAGAWIVDGVVQTKAIKTENATQDTPSQNSTVAAVNLWDLKPIDKRYDFHKREQSRTKQNALWSNVLSLGGRNSYVEYYTNKQYTTLVMAVAPSEHFNSKSNFTLEVYGDDDALLDSFDVDYKTLLADISVDISGQDYVKLVMAGQEAGYINDELLIKNAQFK